MFLMPTTHAQMRLMLASKKSRARSTLSGSFLTISLAISLVSSSKSTTWSLSQRTGRLTWRAILSENSSMEDILSDIISVGWKWPLSSRHIIPLEAA